ncbi:MFS transporter [Nocardioides dongxiaopingii]|uniref:MFS transporter n=1 Tax=Nocardioides sp. S-1144 TaxID=2582905 RepID=UPI00110F0604|nr:MFS transporter [Nocardioides sp. S-1144]QCW51874.1 MFS transporter [Nocardioides sp. S-1144]
MSGSSDPGTDVPRGTRALAWAVLVASVVQVVAPVVTINGPGSSPGAGSGPDLLITPPGWAFSIWGVIYTAAIVQAVWVLARGAHHVPRRLQVDQVVLYLAAAVWIVVAGADSSLGTAAVLLVMLVAAVDGVLTARGRVGPTSLAVATGVASGLFGGWVTAAFFLNVSTALVDNTGLEADQVGWQAVVLVVASVSLVAVTLLARGAPAYAAAGCWALLGIAVTGASDDTRPVLVLAVGAAVVLAAVALLSWWRGRTATSAPAT